MRVAVLGVGLIGGSIGLAARARAQASVCGFDPDPQATAEALRMGAIDEAAPDIASAVAGADVVFAAAPVGALVDTVAQALAACGPDCVVSDVGSTKLALQELRKDERFIGGHPLAGAESAGVGNAREDLFVGAAWYLTPAVHPEEASRVGGAPQVGEVPHAGGASHACAMYADVALYERLRGLIECLGAVPIAVRADAHDRLMARISHLPHVFANVLVAQAADAFAREGSEPAAGPSLKDCARIAGANTAIWKDIYLANADELIAAIDEALERLQAVRAALSGADAQALADWNEGAGAARRALLGVQPSAGAPGISDASVDA